MKKVVPTWWLSAALTTMCFTALTIIMTSCVSGSGTDESELHEQTSIVKVGDRIPEFTVEDSKGNTLYSTDLTGKRSIIFFFQTTCPDCQKVFPVMQELWEIIEGNDSYEMVPVSRGESADEIGKYFINNEMTMPYYIDPELETYHKFAEGYVPRIYIVDSEGIVEWMAVEHLPDGVDSADDLMELL